MEMLVSRHPKEVVYFGPKKRKEKKRGVYTKKKKKDRVELA